MKNRNISMPVVSWKTAAVGPQMGVVTKVNLPSERSALGEARGGTPGFADRETGMAFGFTTDLVPELPGADPVTRDLIATALRCISGEH
jgi:hypothetical protein